jgi:UDP-glucuronate decarboxylase
MMDYHRQHGINIRIVRIFNTYGPKMDPQDGRVVSNFINQAIVNEDITIYGDGSQTRSFCYVSDLVEGLISMMNNTQNFIGPTNLGNTGEMSILEFAQIILKLTGAKSRIIHHSLPQDDPKQRKPDITRAREILGWEPKVGFEEGILKTIEYFKGGLNK